jgi:hypothetical protein
MFPRHFRVPKICFRKEEGRGGRQGRKAGHILAQLFFKAPSKIIRKKLLFKATIVKEDNLDVDRTAKWTWIYIKTNNIKNRRFSSKLKLLWENRCY